MIFDINEIFTCSSLITFKGMVNSDTSMDYGGSAGSSFHTCTLTFTHSFGIKLKTKRSQHALQKGATLLNEGLSPILRNATSWPHLTGTSILAISDFWQLETINRKKEEHLFCTYVFCLLLKTYDMVTINISILSGQFQYCPDGFNTVWTVSILSGHF